MKKLNKIAALFAAVALTSVAVMPAHANTHAAPAAATVDNWRATDGTVWRSADRLCWRNASWTPATAAPGCDGWIVPQPAPAPAPAPVPAPAPAPAPAPVAAPAPAPAPVAAARVTFSADAFFAFDSAVLQPEGRARLDDLVEKIAPINLEVIIAVGHTDSTGPTAYNQKLSERRAEAVKAYLVSKGISADRVYTEGKGETQPVADNRTREGRTQNRRVEIEVVGTRRN